MIRIYGNGLRREEIDLYLTALNEALGTVEMLSICKSTSCFACKSYRVCRELHKMEDYFEEIRDKTPTGKKYHHKRH